MCFNQITISLPLIFTGAAALPENEDHSPHVAHISYSTKTFDETSRRQPLNIRQFLGLHFNLGTTIHYNIENEAGTLRHKQYNLVFLPSTDAECTVEQGKYSALDISFPIPYLMRFQDHFTVLRPFLKNVKNKKLAATGIQHLECNPEMLRTIHDILFNRWTGVCRDIYLHAKIFDLLLFCLKDITEHQRVLLEADIQKVERAHAYLLENLAARFSIELIAQKVAMNKQKLRKGFKLLYNTTMAQFVLHERLDKALTLLRDTSMTIKNIAITVGYKKPSAFTEVFKKKYGCHPTAFRKVSYMLEKSRNGIKKSPLA